MRKAYIPIMIAAILLASCASDDTDLGGRAISMIAIDSTSIQAEYNQNKNDVVVIEPLVSQSQAGQELRYEWEINHEVYSTEPVLRYSCTQLGAFDCRLIVSNDDGKAFSTFRINVNTPYEEGLVIISNAPDGKSMLSFMLHNTDGTPDTFAEGDVFSLNNPEVKFASNVNEVAQSNGSLILACNGNPSAGEPVTIYYLNEKTLDLENYVAMPEYPDFQPQSMMLSKAAYPGASYPTLSSNGKVYEFASTEGTVVTSTKFSYTYDTDVYAYFDDGTGRNYNIFLWDTELGIPVTMFNGYGGYYCIADWGTCANRTAVTPQTNLFAAGADEPVAMFIPRFTKVQLVLATPQIYIITQSGNQLRRTALDKDVWGYDIEEAKNKFLLRESLAPIGMVGTVPFEKGMPMIASNTHKRLFYAIGNRIYHWNYQQTTLAQARLFATVGDAGTVIKGFELSTDQKTLYVAAYNPAESGLNGSCYIIPINQSGTTQEITAGETTAHEHISYNPVKIIYKQK